MCAALRVLVVDDNPQDRRLVIRELRKAYPDAEILEAVDQAQLDKHLEDVEFDVVVTDYHLQWSDGMQVLQAVKKRVPHCPVIMFTGTGSEEIAVEAMKQGLDDYIIKNVKHLVRLRAAVQTVVEHAKTRSRADQLASRLESLLTQLEVGVFSCTPEGRFVEVNDAMRQLLGCPADTQAGAMHLASLFAEESRGHQFLRTLVESQVPQECEIEILKDQSRSKCYRLTARLVQGQSNIPRIDGLLENVTRHKQTEAKAREVAVAVAQIAMLSPRERDVLDQVVAGQPNKVIARRLEISDKTVEKHRASLMRKLRVRSLAELVRLALLAESAQ